MYVCERERVWWQQKLVQIECIALGFSVNPLGIVGTVEVTGEKSSSGALPANQRDSQQRIGSKALTLAGLGNEMLSLLCQEASEHVYQLDHQKETERTSRIMSLNLPLIWERMLIGRKWLNMENCFIICNTILQFRTV